MTAPRSAWRSDNEGAMALETLEMIKRTWVAVDIFSGLKTDQIILAPGHALIIYQVFDAHIICGDIAAAGAAAETQSGIEMVVNPAQTAN
jgi:hypothetical protein